jgi:hypothetical protein
LPKWFENYPVPVLPQVKFIGIPNSKITEHKNEKKYNEGYSHQ